MSKGLDRLEQILREIHRVGLREVDSLDVARVRLEELSDAAADGLDLLTGWCSPEYRIDRGWAPESEVLSNPEVKQAIEQGIDDFKRWQEGL